MWDWELGCIFECLQWTEVCRIVCVLFTWSWVWWFYQSVYAMWNERGNWLQKGGEKSVVGEKKACSTFFQFELSIIRNKIRNNAALVFCPFPSDLCTLPMAPFFFLHPVIHLKCDALRGMESNLTSAMFPVLQCLCIWLPCTHLWPLVTITVKVELKTKHHPYTANDKALTDRRNEWNMPEMGARFKPRWWKNASCSFLLLKAVVQWPLVLLYCGFDSFCCFVFVVTHQTTTLCSKVSHYKP